GVRYTRRRPWQLARLAARIAGLDACNALLDLPEVGGVLIQTLSIGRSQRSLHAGDLTGQHVEDAAVRGAALSALLRRASRSEQLLEDDARIAHHRQRLL